MFDQLKEDLDGLLMVEDPEKDYQKCMSDYLDVLSAYSKWKSDLSGYGEIAFRNIVLRQDAFFQERIHAFEERIKELQQAVFMYQTREWLVEKWKQDVALLNSIYHFLKNTEGKV